jgi:hypothetical protein
LGGGWGGSVVEVVEVVEVVVVVDEVTGPKERSFE